MASPAPSPETEVSRPSISTHRTAPHLLKPSDSRSVRQKLFRNPGNTSKAPENDATPEKKLANGKKASKTASNSSFSIENGISTAHSSAEKTPASERSYDIQDDEQKPMLEESNLQPFLLRDDNTFETHLAEAVQSDPETQECFILSSPPPDTSQSVQSEESSTFVIGAAELKSDEAGYEVCTSNDSSPAVLPDHSSRQDEDGSMIQVETNYRGDHCNTEQESFLFSRIEPSIEECCHQNSGIDVTGKNTSRHCQEMPYLSNLGAALNSSDVEVASTLLKAAYGEALQTENLPAQAAGVIDALFAGLAKDLLVQVSASKNHTARCLWSRMPLLLLVPLVSFLVLCIAFIFKLKEEFIVVLPPT